MVFLCNQTLMFYYFTLLQNGTSVKKSAINKEKIIAPSNKHTRKKFMKYIKVFFNKGNPEVHGQTIYKNILFHSS